MFCLEFSSKNLVLKLDLDIKLVSTSHAVIPSPKIERSRIIIINHAIYEPNSVVWS